MTDFKHTTMSHVMLSIALDPDKWTSEDEKTIPRTLFDGIVEWATQQEHARIVGIIKERIEIGNGFINGCMDHEVEPSPSVLGGLVELKSLLRELEQSK